MYLAAVNPIFMNVNALPNQDLVGHTSSSFLLCIHLLPNLHDWMPNIVKCRSHTGEVSVSFRLTSIVMKFGVDVG